MVTLDLRTIIADEEELPNTVSGLLKAGMEAMSALDRFHYLPWSEALHMGAKMGACRVSLAGALMASTWRTYRNHSYEIEDIQGAAGESVRRKLVALDFAARGMIGEAILNLEEGILTGSPYQKYVAAHKRHADKMIDMNPADSLAVSKWIDDIPGDGGLYSWPSYERYVASAEGMALELEDMGL